MLYNFIIQHGTFAHIQTELKKFYSKRAGLVASKPAGHQRSSVPGSSSSSGKMGNKVWLLILPFASFCLGTWQIFRLRWKVGLVENLEKRTTQPPIAIPAELVSQSVSQSVSQFVSLFVFQSQSNPISHHNHCNSA